MKPFKLNFIFQLFLKIFNLGVCFLEAVPGDGGVLELVRGRGELLPE